MKTLTRIGLVISALLFGHVYAMAGGAGTSGALTLREAKGARSMALGEAFSSVQDDITAFGYNPASLQSLKTGQTSLYYRSGMADDSYGQIMIGSPYNNHGLGFSVGYFDGGKIDVFDGVSKRSINVQKDLTATAGYSFNFGSLDFGLAGKYLSSKLADSVTATAYAADAGIQFSAGPRLRFGSSIQNLGTQLKFRQEGDNLPRMARAGMAAQLFSGRMPVTLMVDGIYEMNESRFTPALGLENSFGPLAFRLGYKGTTGLSQFSAGMGIALSRFSFDYAFGLAKDLDSSHMLSLSMRFGEARK